MPRIAPKRNTKEPTAQKSAPRVFTDRYGKSYLYELPSVEVALPSIVREQPPAPPVISAVLPPQELAGMFDSPSRLAVWQQIQACATIECRLLIRATTLRRLASGLGQSAYRLQSAGLRPICSLGIHTTLYSFSDLLVRHACLSGIAEAPNSKLESGLTRFLSID